MGPVDFIPLWMLCRFLRDRGKHYSVVFSHHARSRFKPVSLLCRKLGDKGSGERDWDHLFDLSVGQPGSRLDYDRLLCR